MKNQRSAPIFQKKKFTFFSFNAIYSIDGSVVVVIVGVIVVASAARFNKGNNTNACNRFTRRLKGLIALTKS